ncbi:WAT1-related protein At5g64700 isoform X2 [Prunus persica]|nr:WAT1-related protein At5g64700 isoform X2 [Prunus persica]
MEGCSYYLAMVLVQLIYGGSNILIKFSLAEGLNPIVFVVYRHVMAMVLVGPFAYVLERKQRPSLSFSVAAKIFMLALFGTTIHLNVYYAGLAYTSPTVACALSNVIPSLTFLMAVLLGLEKLKIRTARGQAKVAGTLFCIGGSLVFTFWKGGYLFRGFVKRPLINISVAEMRHVKENWIKGALLILTSHIAWSAWLILQAVVSKVYTARLSLTTMICFFASLQSSFLALFFARNPISWRLEWNLQLLTIVYCGVVISALAYYLQTWCISYRGPVFAAMFSPLQVVIVALFSALAFAERLHFGSGGVQLDRNVSHYCGSLLCAVGKEERQSCC